MDNLTARADPFRQADGGSVSADTLATAMTTCEHGYIPSTCSTCSRKKPPSRGNLGGLLGGSQAAGLPARFKRPGHREQTADAADTQKGMQSEIPVALR